jgi:signal transduction histidine kinase
VDGASTELAAALAELRELARGIHPAILTDRGLEPAIAALADRAPVPVDVDVQDDLGLPPAHEAALYFVASEALANVAKYAGGTGASIRVWREADRVAIEIADDGKGGADPAQGSGLSGLRDRVEAMDGRLAVSSPPGAGTRVRATLPVAPPATTPAEEPAPSASA